MGKKGKLAIGLTLKEAFSFLFAFVSKIGNLEHFRDKNRTYNPKICSLVIVPSTHSHSHI